MINLNRTTLLVDVNTLPEVPKDAKLKAWFIQTLEVSGLTRNWRQSDALLQRPRCLLIGEGDRAKTGVLSREIKCSKKWRGWGDLELLLTGNCKVAK